MKQKLQNLRKNINQVITGKDDTITLLLTALLANGHVLLEDLPGCGKTTLAKALAKSISGNFCRVQFTPDLLPADITGISIYNTKTCEFEFKQGPVFTNILLADEINRATPRTQSALLECMEERQVTADGTTYKLGNPFFVIATQNPIETAGTFPLPEAQMDRFAMQLSLGYPDKEAELALLTARNEAEPLYALEPVLTVEEFVSLKEAAASTYIHPCIIEYIADIADKSRRFEDASHGISPRGSLSLMNCSKAYAFLHNKTFVTPEDIQTLAIPVLAHRLMTANGYMGRSQAVAMLSSILDTVPTPTEDWRNI